ncbi:MAG: UDP-N-acetylmuramoyl-L-alanine--D-glutamate ligase [Jatrophihabitans sp.]|nr:MAG: UDP-N-acetylmuramoyl-L-alanine--D-glutamate ligase [Jatrophihabitans sp.]
MDEFAPGRTVLVCGAGLAGRTAARALLDRGARVLVADRVESDATAALAAQGARYIGSPPSVPDGVSLVVTSPGWRPDAPLLRDAASRGLAVLGEVEFAWRLRGPGAAPWLAVTGTNGKTTTVRMLESILRAAGHDALAVGNVGVPVIEAVASGGHDVLAVEVSSFQLHWSSTFAPAAAALLNLAPDHLDWHGSMAAYAAAKALIWRGPVAIGNADDAGVERLLAAAAAPRKVRFTLAGPGPGELGVRDGVLLDAAFAHAPVPLLPAVDVRPSGDHNVADALAAAALARSFGVPAEAVAAGLRSFVPDPHRNQFVVSSGGIDWVDDSKATNPHAARASLLAYPSVVWLAGGQLKGAPVEELVAEVARRLRAVVLLGQDRAEIAAALRRHAPDVPVIDVVRTDDGAMSEAVRAAAGCARPGDTVLLAPAAASYDMFSGYSARGAAFAAAARALPHP